MCVSAVVFVACPLLLDDKAQACDRTRCAAEGHGEAQKTKREKALADLLLSIDREQPLDREVEGGSVEYRRRKKTSRCKQRQKLSTKKTSFKTHSVRRGTRSLPCGGALSWRWSASWSKEQKGGLELSKRGGEGICKGA